MNIKTVFYHVLVLAVINSAAQAEPAATSTVRAKHVKKHDETQASRTDNLSTGSPWSWIKRQAGRAGRFVKKHKKPIIASGVTAAVVSLIAYMLHRRRVARLQGEHQGELRVLLSEHARVPDGNLQAAEVARLTRKVAFWKNEHREAVGREVSAMVAAMAVDPEMLAFHKKQLLDSQRKVAELEVELDRLKFSQREDESGSRPPPAGSPEQGGRPV